MFLKESRIILGILILALLVFSPCLKNGWVNWDDQAHVFDVVPANVGKIFTSLVNLTYIPLTELTFNIEHQYVRFKPFLYHLDNLFLYLADIALVFLCARRFGLSLLVAAAGTLCFALHPLHVESVAWVTERKDVLYGFFYLAALYFYFCFVQEGRRFQYVLSIICGVLSMLAKPMAASFPLVLFLFDWLLRRSFNIRLVLEKLPHMLLIGCLALVTYYANARIIHVFSFASVLTWIWSFVFYIKSFILPIQLYPLHWLPRPISLSNSEYLISTVAFAMIVWSLIRFKGNRWYLGAWAFYFSSIFFLLHFDDQVDINVVADRFMFLPMAGFCFLLGVGLEALCQRAQRKYVHGSSMVLVFFGAVMLLMCVQSYGQCSVWHDSISLWDHELKYLPSYIGQYPKLEIVYSNLASAYNDKGDSEKVIFYSTKVLDIDPHSPSAYVAYTDRGQALQIKGDLDKALEDLNKAIAIDPKMPNAYNVRINVHLKKGMIKEALSDYKKELEVNSHSAEICFNLAALYLDQGDLAQAVSYNTKAISIDPNYADAYFNRGAAYQRMGNSKLAIADYERAVGFNPDLAMAYNNLALAYYLKGDYSKAWESLNRAVELGAKPQSGFLEDLKRDSGRIKK